MNCKKCGAPLAEGAVFCATCGSRADEQPVAAQPVQQPPPQYQPQPQYQPPPVYRQPRQPGQGFMTLNPGILEMILKIGAMVVALFALVNFIVLLTLRWDFFNSFFSMAQGFGVSVLMFAAGQLLIATEKK